MTVVPSDLVMTKPSKSSPAQNIALVAEDAESRCFTEQQPHVTELWNSRRHPVGFAEQTQVMRYAEGRKPTCFVYVLYRLPGFSGVFCSNSQPDAGVVGRYEQAGARVGVDVDTRSGPCT